MEHMDKLLCLLAPNQSSVWEAPAGAEWKENEIGVFFLLVSLLSGLLKPSGFLYWLLPLLRRPSVYNTLFWFQEQLPILAPSCPSDSCGSLLLQAQDFLCTIWYSFLLHLSPYFTKSPPNNPIRACLLFLLESWLTTFSQILGLVVWQTDKRALILSVSYGTFTKVTTLSQDHFLSILQEVWKYQENLYA